MWIVSTVVLGITALVLAIALWQTRRKFHIQPPLQFVAGPGDSQRISLMRNGKAQGYLCYPAMTMSCKSTRPGTKPRTHQIAIKGAIPAGGMNWVNPTVD